MLKTYRIIPLVFILFLFGFTLITVSPLFAQTVDQLIESIEKLDANDRARVLEYKYSPPKRLSDVTPAAAADGPWDKSMGMRHPNRPCMKNGREKGPRFGCGRDMRSPEQIASDPYDTNNPVSLAARGESGADSPPPPPSDATPAAVADGPWDISMGMRHPNRPRMKWEDEWWRGRGPDGRECTVCDPLYNGGGSKHFIEDWNACGIMATHWARSITGVDGMGNTRTNCVEYGQIDEGGFDPMRGKWGGAGSERVCLRYGPPKSLTAQEKQQVLETCISDRAKGCRGEYYRTGIIASDSSTMHLRVDTMGKCKTRMFHNFGKKGAFGKTWWFSK
jgi:hypothetical protein